MLCRPPANLSMFLVTLSSAGCIVRNAAVKEPAAGAPANVAAGGGIGAQDLPAPPGAGAPRPNGAPGNLAVLDWAGFRAAATYTFDDTNGSQIQHYDELRALGVRMTFYLITGKREFADPVWARALRDGHEL